MAVRNHLFNSRQLIKNKFQRLVNWWGSRRRLFMWTFNELNILNTDVTAQQNFVQDVGTFLAAIDPY